MLSFETAMQPFVLTEVPRRDLPGEVSVDPDPRAVLTVSDPGVGIIQDKGPLP